MIVMKFGGSSLESGQAIRRVTSIVKSYLPSKPLVVVSAIGDTTDALLKLASEAENGHRYLAWKGLKELSELHLETAAEVSSGESLRWLEGSLHKHFENLHRLLLRMEHDDAELTPALLDEIVSYGERLSSEVVAAALQSAGVPTIHLDARQFIVTDDRFMHAKPLYWETYAKLRRLLPRVGESRTPVMGGFIGATESGATTTLGRGGSDLTASLVGAGICAEEIQFWKDVDGILTCSPKLADKVYRLKSISYQEATAIAQGGAEVLHPDAMKPTARQRIPIVIRNSRRPESTGTRIVASLSACRNAFKSIATRQNVTVLAMRSHGDANGSVEDLQQLCERHGVSPELVARSGGVDYLCVKSSERYERLQLGIKGCIEVRLHTERAAVTLVGSSGPASEAAGRVLAVLKQFSPFVVSDQDSRLALTVVVPQKDLRKCVEILHREFFAQMDLEFFAEVERQPKPDAKPETVREIAAQLRYPSVKRLRPVLTHSPC